jgi:flagellar motor component MotA
MKTCYRDVRSGEVFEADIITPDSLEKNSRLPIYVTAPPPMKAPKRKRRTRIQQRRMDPLHSILEIAERADTLGVIGVAVGGVMVMQMLKRRGE